MDLQEPKHLYACKNTRLNGKLFLTLCAVPKELCFSRRSKHRRVCWTLPATGISLPQTKQKQVTTSFVGGFLLLELFVVVGVLSASACKYDIINLFS
jgi:hypothetical protein